jgi:hypothetical protein
MTSTPAPRPGRPVTYGTEQAARAYVTRILAAAPSAPRGAVYITVSPAVRTSDMWPELAAALAALLPGIRFRHWGNLAAAGIEPGPGLGARLAAAHRAVIVAVPRMGTEGRRPVGPGALAEASAFRSAGRPVLAFTGRRLVAWPDVRVRPVPAARRPSGIAGWADVPGTPPSPLPTLHASLRVLGITAAADVDRASAGLDGPELAA